MTFDEILAQITELLKRQGRVSYGALKRRFDLDDDYLVAGAKCGPATTTLVASQRVRTPMRVSWTSHS
jgi:hypothetical protein